MSRLSQNFKLLRMVSGMSQTELAKRLNLSRNQINNYENDLSQPSIDVLYKLCKLFNVSMDEMVSYEFKSSELKKKINP